MFEGLQARLGEIAKKITGRGTLSEEEMWHTVNYVKALSK